MRNDDQLGDGRGPSINANGTIGAAMPSSVSEILRITDFAFCAIGCRLVRAGFNNLESSMLEKI